MVEDEHAPDTAKVPAVEAQPVPEQAPNASNTGADPTATVPFPGPGLASMPTSMPLSMPMGMPMSFGMMSPFDMCLGGYDAPRSTMTPLAATMPAGGNGMGSMSSGADLDSLWNDTTSARVREQQEALVAEPLRETDHLSRSSVNNTSRSRSASLDEAFETSSETARSGRSSSDEFEPVRMVVKGGRSRGKALRDADSKRESESHESDNSDTAKAEKFRSLSSNNDSDDDSRISRL